MGRNLRTTEARQVITDQFIVKGLIEGADDILRVANFGTWPFALAAFTVLRQIGNDHD